MYLYFRIHQKMNTTMIRCIINYLHTWLASLLVETVMEGSNPVSEVVWRLPARRIVSSVGSKVMRDGNVAGMVNSTKLWAACHTNSPYQKLAVQERSRQHLSGASHDIIREDNTQRVHCKRWPSCTVWRLRLQCVSLCGCMHACILKVWDGTIRRV